MHLTASVADLFATGYRFRTSARSRAQNQNYEIMQAHNFATLVPNSSKDFPLWWRHSINAAGSLVCVQVLQFFLYHIWLHALIGQGQMSVCFVCDKVLLQLHFLWILPPVDPIQSWKAKAASCCHAQELMVQRLHRLRRHLMSAPLATTQSDCAS